MRDIPSSVIASWPKPDYAHPETRGSVLIIVNSVLIALAILAVTLRIYARVCVSQWFGADDACIVLALILAIGMTVCVLLANISYGWNRHVWDVPTSLIAPAFQIVFATKIVFSLAGMFTRLSLTLFYYRLVKDSGMQRFRIAIHFVLAFGVAVGLASVFFTIFQCSPIRAFWTYPSIRGSKCLDEGVLTLACGIAIAFADLLTAVLPIPMIARLKMPIGRRIGIAFLLGLGFVVVLAGGARCFFIWYSLIKSYDETWYSYPLWIAAAVEIDLAVICACVPSFRLLLHSFVRLDERPLSAAAYRGQIRHSSPPSVSTIEAGLVHDLGPASPEEHSDVGPVSPGSFGSTNRSLPSYRSKASSQFPKKKAEVNTIQIGDQTWEMQEPPRWDPPPPSPRFKEFPRIPSFQFRNSADSGRFSIRTLSKLAGIRGRGDSISEIVPIPPRSNHSVSSFPRSNLSISSFSPRSEHADHPYVSKYATQERARTVAWQQKVREMTDKASNRSERRNQRA